MALIAAAVLEERRQYTILERFVKEDDRKEVESSSSGDQEAE